MVAQANRFSHRLAALRRLLHKQGPPALLVTKRENVAYLTGFTGDDSYLLVTATDAIVLSDMRFASQLEEECPQLNCDIRGPGGAMSDLIAQVVRRCRLPRLGIEAEVVSVAFHRLLVAALDQVTIEPCGKLVESLREIKDRTEIEEIRRAVQLAQRAFQVVRAQLRPEQSEKQLAAELEYQIRQFGGAGCSFAPIVAVGNRAALPHAVPTDRRVADADFVLLDWGAKSGGYASDLTRVLVTGKISPKLERVYGVVLRAQQRAIETIRPGVRLSDVDAAARELISQAGYGRCFGHGLGHGIGLEIHEAPRLAINQDRPLKAGMVVTVEPGVYLPGWGGVRIEDDVLVTRDGHEVLSDLDKELDGCLVS